MEILIAAIGLFTFFNLNKKEKFEDTFLESESYIKPRDESLLRASQILNYQVKQSNQSNQNNQSNQSNQNNQSNQSNQSNLRINDNFSNYYYLNGEQQQENREEFIAKNSLYSQEKINGIPLKDYLNTYSKKVLDSNEWFLAKDLPSETKQYLDNSAVQQRMEIFTGERQRRDREMGNITNKKEIANLFTPAERTTGYGYLYGTNGSGPGTALARNKEVETYTNDIKFKTNEQPFEKIIVGKGIGIDPEVPAAGGFQQYARVLPENISDYKANQLAGRVAGGKWVFSNAPTSQQPVVKNRPNGYYSLCNRGPAAGKSVMTAETLRPDVTVLLKNQNRATVNSGFGYSINSLDSYLCK